jgi:hypothetical protein
VPLAPVEVAHNWHQRRAARFADARGATSYDRARIAGAVNGPVPDGGSDDPVAGTDVSSLPDPRTIRGRTGPAHAGETACVRHGPSGQREAGPIGADGTFALELRFSDVTPDSELAAETPAYRAVAPMGDLLSGVVTGPDGA